MFRLILFVSCLWTLDPLVACDICGGFSLNPQAGSITQVNRHFLSWSYGYVPFEAKNLTYSEDHFHNQILQGQYMLSDRWSIGATLLWSSAFRQLTESEVEVAGWGNPMFQVFYAPLVRQSPNAKWIWRTGFGVRFPFGTHDSSIHDQHVPENFNPSDGAWGAIWQNDLVRLTRYWAFNASAMNLWRGQSPDNSQLGNQTNIQGSAAYLHSLNSHWVASPLAGLGWEYLSANRYPSGKTVRSTGGHNTFLHAGLSLNHTRGSVSCRYSYPFHNGLNNSNIRPQSRWIVQATFFINS